MAWPQATEYSAAIQNPAACFADAELASGQVAADAILGLPLCYSGNFASVFKVACPGGHAWAVKCFTRDAPDRQDRYALISRHLGNNRRKFAMEFQYLQTGICVKGAWHPALKMRWVEGMTLNEFVREHAASAALLGQLSGLWLRLACELREARMAHGDLQHGNVLLVPGTRQSAMLLRLIDYDGMWVPDLDGRPPCEAGHANYQHPARPAQGGYGAEADRFSLLAVYAALRCLMAGGKALFDAFDTGENLLFRESDFRAPAASRLLPVLLGLPDAGAIALVGHLVDASLRPLHLVPFLPDLVDGSQVKPLSAEQHARLQTVLPGWRGQYAASPIDWLRGATPLPAGPLAGVGRPVTVEPIPIPPVPVAVLRVVGGSDSAIMPALPAEELPAPPATPPPLTAVKALHPPPATPPPLPAARRPWWKKRGVIGGCCAGVLATVVLGLAWPGSPPPPQPPPRPRLLPLARIVLRAGKSQQVPVPIEQSAGADLRVEVDGLPPGVSCPPACVGPAAGCSARLRLSAARGADVPSANVTVALFADGEKVDEQTVALTVEKFLGPSLRDLTPKPIVLTAGQPRLLLARVDANGNSDPWTLRVDGLPRGVVQRPPREAVPAGHAAVELAATGPEVVGQVVTVVLLADGVVCDRKLVSLSVEVPKRDPTIDLNLPPDVRLQAGEKASVAVRLTRHDHDGEVLLRMNDLPAGVSCADVTVPGGQNQATLDIAAARDAGDRLRLRRLRLIALVDGKQVGAQAFTLRLEKAPMPPSTPKEDPLPAPEQVKMTTADSLTVCGTFYPLAKGRKGPCVLMLHDVTHEAAQDESWRALALALQKQGCAVFMLDFRGFGASAAEEVPPAFWTSCKANQQLHNDLLRVKGAVKQKVIGQRLPARPRYLPWLVQDVVAARLWLDLQHDAERVNTRNLFVVAAGKASHLGLLWLSAECRRFSAGAFLPALVTPVFESRDVAGCVWIEPPAVKVGLLHGGRAALNALAAEKELPPMAVVFDQNGQQADAGAALAKLLRQTAAPAGPCPVDGVEGRNEAVVSFVAACVQKRGLRGWEQRNMEKNNYYWRLGAGMTYPAKRVQFPIAGEQREQVPDLLPLSDLGFKDLSLR